MSRRAAILTVVLAGLAAAPAWAQTPPSADPIGELLRAPLSREVDPEEPDTAAAGSRVDPDPTPLAAQRYVPPPRTTLTSPAFVNETGKAPDGPLTATDLAYDSRLKSSMASAQAFQGPMDGGWTLSAGARELYIFQFTDRKGAVEGAWRDTRRVGALDASGLIDQVERGEASLALRFGAEVVVELHGEADGRWTGELKENGRIQAVNLRRRNP